MALLLGGELSHAAHCAVLDVDADENPSKRVKSMAEHVAEVEAPLFEVPEGTHRGLATVAYNAHSLGPLLDVFAHSPPHKKRIGKMPLFKIPATHLHALRLAGPNKSPLVEAICGPVTDNKEFISAVASIADIIEEADGPLKTEMHKCAEDMCTAIEGPKRLSPRQKAILAAFNLLLAHIHATRHRLAHLTSQLGDVHVAHLPETPLPGGGDAIQVGRGLGKAMKKLGQKIKRGFKKGWRKARPVLGDVAARTLDIASVPAQMIILANAVTMGSTPLVALLPAAGAALALQQVGNQFDLAGDQAEARRTMARHQRAAQEKEDMIVSLLANHHEAISEMRGGAQPAAVEESVGGDEQDEA